MNQVSLWTVNDVAKYLQVSRSWVYQQAEDGRLPSLKIGALLRFDPDTIKAFARGQVSPTPTRMKRKGTAVKGGLSKGRVK